MPHPVRDNQTTTTPPHQPSPPHPTPAGDPPGRPTSPPSRLPTPPLAARRGRSWRAGRPVAQPTLAGWRAGLPPPPHNSRLPPAAPNGSSAGSRARGFSLLSAARLHAAPPPLAALRATNWGHVGCRWVGPAEQASGPPCSRSCGPRSTCAWPGWCLWATRSRSCFSASLPAVPSPLCTGSAPSVGLAGALVRSGVTELGWECAGWGGEALARSCAAHVVGSRADCPHGWGGGRATMCKGRR